MSTVGSLLQGSNSRCERPAAVVALVGVVSVLNAAVVHSQPPTVNNVCLRVCLSVCLSASLCVVCDVERLQQSKQDTIAVKWEKLVRDNLKVFGINLAVR